MKAGTSNSSHKRGRPKKQKPTDSESDIPSKTFDKDEVDLSQPAKSMSGFLNMIAVAKLHGVDAIEATKEVMTHAIKNGYDSDVGYFIYQNVYVFEVGRKEEIMNREKRTMQQLIFGDSKVVIGNNATIQEYRP